MTSATYRGADRATRRATWTMPPEAHGTPPGYYKYACLCDDCRAAARAYRRSLTRYHRVVAAKMTSSHTSAPASSQAHPHLMADRRVTARSS